MADRWRRMWVNAARLLAVVGDASSAQAHWSDAGADDARPTEDATGAPASMGKEVELRRAHTELSASRLWANFLADKLQVFALAPPTQEATQGQIPSQYPSDATSWRWH